MLTKDIINLEEHTQTNLTTDTTDYIHVEENFISRDQCAEYLKAYEEIRHLSKKNKRSVSGFEKVINEVLLNDISPYWNSVVSHVDSLIFEKIKKYLNQFLTLGPSSYELDNIVIWEQKIGEFAPLHYDKEWLLSGEDEKYQHRNFLCLLYLNDNYEGGELIFPVQKKVIKPQTGTLVIFPTSLMFPHKTIPAELNNRYLMRLTYVQKD